MAQTVAAQYTIGRSRDGEKTHEIEQDNFALVRQKKKQDAQDSSKTAAI
jgi:hypothetical protein